MNFRAAATLGCSQQMRCSSGFRLPSSLCPHMAGRRAEGALGFPGGSDGEESACNVGDQGLVPGSGRSLGEGNGNPLQYSCLGNSMGRGAWQATVRGVTKS